MAEVKEETSTQVITPPFILSYPRVWTPRKVEYDDGSSAQKWSISMLFKKSQAKDLIILRKAAITAVTAGKSKIPQSSQEKIVAYFKSSSFYTKEKIGKIRVPFHDGDESDDETYKDCITLNAGATKGERRHELPVFKMVGNKAIRLDPENPTDQEEIYPGCICVASLNAYTYEVSGAGVTFGLNGLTKLRDGQRIDNSVNAEDQFNAAAATVAAYDDPFDPAPEKQPELNDEEEETEEESWG